jgi:hypothetical protein
MKGLLGLNWGSSPNIYRNPTNSNVLSSGAFLFHALTLPHFHPTFALRT